MRRDQLEHAIRAACQIARQLEVIIVGSQAILGTYPEDELPRLATRSLEIDVLPITDDNNETIRLADLIVGAAGEFSTFEQLHGFSIDGVDLTTSALPEGWRTRLVKVQNETRPHHPVNPSTSAGAWTKKTSVSQSCVPSGKRTATS
ncbi:DUF6036 family nucleotidyltransferase [Mycobacterium gastri]|uniref:DUF6036 family nucleotidyltransferase n=1 Tax=Mycobacterium gastri TaxID=1777 RepID=UPI0003E5A6F2|nr:DUF6036 family nucleotidyltransferase [Mycobacterium gastri]ETW23126.1 hypothetical protein MGAST_15910 [Mycobacterium gastri 'Wayne']